MRKKILGLLLILFLGLTFFAPSNVYAKESEDKQPVNESLPANDTALYKAFKDNNFPLYTYEEDIDGGMLGINKFGAQIGIFLKNLLWACTVFIAKASVWVAEASFKLDMTASMKEFSITLTQNLATNLTSIASTLGVCFLIGGLLFKFALTGKLGEILKVVFLGIAIFTLLVLLRSNAEEVINTTVDIGDSIEYEMLKASPTINSNGEVETVNQEDVKNENIQQKSAELLGVTVFKNNVFLPYLDLQYGSTNLTEIQKKSITIDDTDYERVSALLNNENNDKFTSKVVEEEINTFDNSAMNHKQALGAAGNAFLYGLISLIQLVIFFIGSLLKNVVIILIYFLFPIIIIGLFWCLIKVSFSPLLHFSKSTGILIFLKASIFTVLLIYSSVITIGFQSSYGQTGIGRFMITFLFIFMPFAVYWLRFVFLGILQGNMKMALHGFQQARQMHSIKQLTKQEATKAKLEKRRQEAADKKEKMRQKEQEEATPSPKQRKDVTPNKSKRRNDIRNTKDRMEDTSNEGTEQVEPKNAKEDIRAKRMKNKLKESGTKEPTGEKESSATAEENVNKVAPVTSAEKEGSKSEARHPKQRNLDKDTSKEHTPVTKPVKKEESSTRTSTDKEDKDTSREHTPTTKPVNNEGSSTRKPTNNTDKDTSKEHTPTTKSVNTEGSSTRKPTNNTDKDTSKNYVPKTNTMNPKSNFRQDKQRTYPNNNQSINQAQPKGRIPKNHKARKDHEPKQTPSIKNKLYSNRNNPKELNQQLVQQATTRSISSPNTPIYKQAEPLKVRDSRYQYKSFARQSKGSSPLNTREQKNKSWLTTRKKHRK